MAWLRMNIAIVFPDFGPYHVARIEALDKALKSNNSKLFAIQFSRVSSAYGWNPVHPAGVDVLTLGERWPVNVIEALKMATSFRRVLREQKMDVVFLPSYSPLPNLLCLLIAKLVGCKVILMNESWHGTEKVGFLGRMLKHVLVRSFDAALVGGNPQREYAHAYGLKRSNIFLGYDVVDIDYFSREAKRWKEVAVENLPISNLPDRYFLNLGRFVSKKNIGFLIQAYANLYKTRQAAFIALVLVGEGEEEQTIRQVALENNLPVRNGLNSAQAVLDGPEVVFYPFQQVDKTPIFFSHCEAFILPSLHEEWGLVINEAMACEATVLVSKNVGCAQDLVLEGKNGFQFDPTNVEELTRLLAKFINEPMLARSLGQNGSNIIRHWGPSRFAEGALSAIQSIDGQPATSTTIKTSA